MNNILDRILPILKKNQEIEQRSDLWNWCKDHHDQVEINEANLENMANTNLVWGFFGGTVSGDNYDTIVKLAQAVGVIGIQNPENPEGTSRHWPKENQQGKSADELLDLIQTKLPFKIDLPMFVGGRTSLQTKYGIITDRHCHYLYIMKRIVELFPDRNTRIVEIGAGLGLLGYFLDKAGYNDYTTFDLSHANACQAYFLSRNLPKRGMILSGERMNPAFIDFNNAFKILHSTDFIPGLRYDLMINIDGLTEMIPDEAGKYFNSDCAPLLLSINHEINDYRVCEIDPQEKVRKRIYRYPFWLRGGYVEELFELKT